MRLLKFKNILTMRLYEYRCDNINYKNFIIIFSISALQNAFNNGSKNE